MEHEKYKEVRQSTLQFRCEKIPQTGKSGDHAVADAQIMKSDEKQGHGFSLASPTPEKIIQPPRTRKSKEHIYHFRTEAENSKMLPDTGCNNELAVETCDKGESGDDSDPKNFEQNPHFSIQSLEEKTSQLSEKHKVIGELFDKMLISVRLLSLRRKLTSFQNISTQVEILAKKKFMLCHLAQMKYLFPEALHIEKILTHDQASICMKPDIKVSLILDAAKDIDDSLQASYVDLCKAFHARILDFLNTHPEGGEIPAAPLPDSFMQEDPTISPNQLPVGLSMDQLCSVSVGDNLLFGASHLCPSFSGHFSQRILDPEKQTAEYCDSSISMISMDPLDGCNEEIKNHSKNDYPHFLPNYKSPTKIISSPDHHACLHSHQKTPVKLGASPAKLMTETPSLSTPKRLVASPDVKLLTQAVMSNHSARRSLIYSPSKPDRGVSDSVADVTDSLCYKIPCSQERDKGRSFNEDETDGYCSADLQMAQEKTEAHVNHHDLRQTGSNRRRQMLASLPDLFNAISFIFGSKDCNTITKQELVHKILSYNSDIEDTDEIEEQLHLLEELVPDWIAGKTTSSGDIMYSISRASDPKSIRARLIEAV